VRFIMNVGVPAAIALFLIWVVAEQQAARVVAIAGDRGHSTRIADTAVAALPGSRRAVLADYSAQVWNDCVSDRTEAIVAALLDLPGTATSLPANPRIGLHEGISYDIQGRGPALVLFPLMLSAAQWDAALPALTARYTVIRLGGRHLSGVAVLEGRGESPSYMAMLYQMLETIAPAPGASILEVGCGCGALIRRVALRLGPDYALTGVDLNPFMLREAAALAEQDGLAGRLRFQQGNAEQLPFPDASFDHAYTVTVLEECDADKALRELRRVVKPGGGVGVIVRAIDRHQSWNIDLPDAIRRKIEIPPQSIGKGGVADASLYRRFAAAGFQALSCSPALASFAWDDTPFIRYREEAMLARLTLEEAAVWDTAKRASLAAGVLFTTNPFHCVTGRHP
jgi:ubiquinone/menaquinone biosynthesis C-methylase UbiE